MPLFPLLPLLPVSASAPPCAGPGPCGTQPWKTTTPVGVCTRWVLVLGQLLVDLVVQRGAQRRVGGEVGHHQRDDGDRPDREEESEPE